jgi:hypothetical protein
MGRHGGWSAAASGIALVFLAVGLVVLSPVIVFLVVPFVVRRYRKRLEFAACAFRCRSCGGILGLESLRLADNAWRAYFQRRLEEHYRVRVVRHLHAICPACGVRYTFVERERTFVPARDDRTLPGGGSV